METWDCSLRYPDIRPHDLSHLIEPDHPLLSVSRQAELLGVSRRSVYYQPEDNSAAEALLKRDVDAIDAIYTDYPFYGSRRMKDELLDRYGIDIGRERIRRVMRLLGLEAVYPKPNTSEPGTGPSHHIYPYLLRGIAAQQPNHVWGTDITYIKTADGFVYLVAFMDWYSRYVVSWGVSDSLENSFVLQTLREALQFARDCGLPVPDIVNSDQGSHFTAQAYLDIIEQTSARISMDSRGRYLDNIFTERLWRSVKYENVFLKSYQGIDDAREGLTEYFNFYNNKRRHQSLDRRTPARVYFDVRTDQPNGSKLH